MSKYKYIPTKKLTEILDDPYTRGSNGRDYEPVRHELEQVLWERENRITETTIERDLRELEMYDRIMGFSHAY